ncbi:unnamed protein product [Bemisia tabaci]|uniref:Prolyl-tRNA synthetase n=2 Tax=Bemisia tabaci TaxID=7038 RepID=A0A9P0AFI8_BEMTA|nr:unnamed protein product [Bemisia tabaci]
MGKKLLPLLADPQDPPLGALVVVEIIYKSMPVFVDWNAKETSLTVIPNVKFTTDVSICRYLAKFNQDFKLFGESDIVGLEVDQWLTFSIGPLKCNVEFPSAISYLNQVLAIRTYLVDNKLTVADICVWAALYPNSQWNKLIEDGKAPAHVLRWYNFINSLECVTAAVARLPSSDMSSNKKSKPESAPKSQSSASERKQEGKFLKLPNAEKGHVVVRFPPEASGYLHIGHAKAALLNQYYQQEFEGKLIMRFDDTNPAKEKVDFEKVILEDVEMLKIKPDIFTRTSDHFEKLLELCEKMLQEGKAYVDDTDPEVMKNEREKRVESANRNNDVEKNMKMWKEMKEGSEFGQKCCVRAKIDMQSANGCMRDPTMYRCKNEPHPCHGNKYKVYPTYDFACPVVDSIEGVTHALRTTEYQDRDEQFYWFIEALGLRKPHIEAYSRLNMTHTVLSKRKLTWFVDNKIVDGWDDPRMPTVRGVLRHGMTVEGLRQFILAQGSSRSVVFMEWDKIWAFNKKVIDPVAPRYSAVEMSFTPVFVKGVNKSTATVAKHPKNPDIGSRNIVLDSKIIIDSEDANALKEAENTTFIGWGNLKITKINKENGNVTSVEAEPNLENKDFKNTLKLSWLAENEENTPCLFVYCDHLMSKAVLGKDEDFKDFINTNSKVVKAMIGDPDLKTLKKSDIIQIQRKGFFICDEPYKSASANNAVESPVVLMYIPDGHSKPMATSGIQKPDPATNKAKETQSKSAKNSSSKKDSTSAPEKILELIQEQGDKIRKLKGDKADKTVITAEVQVLLGLKEDFKKATGLEWKPGITLEPASCPAKTSTTSDAGAPEEILEKIQVQGDKIRILKADKADKAAITAEVQILLGLKEEFKKATGLEWKPGITLGPASCPAKPSSTSDANTPEAILEKIQVQGDKIRQLKADKADKSVITAEVQTLLGLKEEFKKVTGSEWKPGITLETKSCQAKTSSTSDANTPEAILEKIQVQGDKIRQLKADKADKSVITAEVQTLLGLKEEFKKTTGLEWKPGITLGPASCPAKPSTTSDANTPEAILEKIQVQGDKIRQLKADKADKAVITAEVQTLLGLKEEFKKATGLEWKPGITLSASGNQTGTQGAAPVKPAQTSAKEKKEKPAKGKPVKEKTPPAAVSDSKNAALKKQTRLGLEARKEDNLADWYSQIITKGELIEYYDVSGCYILRPNAFAIWEVIQSWLDKELKKLGVKNCYFPIFVSKAVLEKEKDHISDFAPEVAWVTKSGSSDMAEPIAIRPTSETVMYPAYAKWIQSHRDLPIKLNQWNNVVRWEFKHPQPFIRTREFLWQEGHSAYASRADAEEEVLQILGLYEKIYSDLLAIPVVRGKKTNKEKFAGGDYTTTVEAFVSASGRAVQGATSHFLGQNFSKMFEIIYEDPETQEKKFVFQNSWGITTRTIGVMIMVHGDNQGLVIPPRVASVQVVIVPCGISASMKDDEKKELYKSCSDLASQLQESGVKVESDFRENYSPGWKFNSWELKGVPVRVELGPKDMKNNQFVAVRRDTNEKIVFSRSKAVEDVKTLLDTIQSSMLQRAKDDLNSHIKLCKDWANFCSYLDGKNIILSPFCGEISCEDKIKESSARDDTEVAGAPAMGAKSLCIPFDQPKEGISATDKCINPSCSNKPQFYTLFGRSY